MRLLLVMVVLVLAIGALASWRASAPAAAGSAGAAHIEVACAPRGGALRAIRAAIAAAHHSIHVLGPISGGTQVTSELSAAAARGVQVALVVPPLADGSSRALARALLDAGVPVSEDDEHAGMLGDTLIIDEDTVVSAPSIADGAEQDEVAVVLVVHDRRTATTCADVWSVHAAHARVAGPVRAARTPAPLTPANQAPDAPAASPTPATPSDSSLSPFSTTHRQH